MLSFPTSAVTVLAPERTFWEKATLMHVECHRPAPKADADRLSRHWYDLSRLASSSFGTQALADRELLADVVRHKKVFYNSSYANYDACLHQQLRLVPEGALLDALQRDYQTMQRAGMFSSPPPDFPTLIGQLRELEQRINH